MPVTNPSDLNELEIDLAAIVADLATPTSGNSGQTTIAVTNTPIVLGASTAIRGVVVKAKDNNSAPVYVGFSNAVTTSTGYELWNLDAQPFWIDNLNKLYIVGTAGDGVTYAYIV